MAFDPKKDAKNYTNEFMKLFEEYRKENINIKKWISRFDSIFREVETLKSKIKKSIDEKTVFGKNVDEKDKEIFESLSRDLSIMKSLTVKILSQIEKEDPKISEFIGRISHDEISTAGFSFDLIKEYNKDKYLAVQEFIGLMPNFSKDLDGVIELPLIKISESADHFKKFASELINLVQREPSKGAMFESVGILLNYLIHYVGNVETLSQNEKTRFIGSINGSPNPKQVKQIAENYLNSIGSAYNIFDEFNKLLSLMDIKLSTRDTSGNTYNSLDDDKKKKIDKFTATTLKILFNGVKIKIKGEEKEVYNMLETSLYKPDLSEVQKEFIRVYTELFNHKLSKLNYNFEKKPEDLMFICDGLSNAVSFKDFMSNKFEDGSKSVIKSGINYMVSLIDSAEDEKPFTIFIQNNISKHKVLKREPKKKEDSEKKSDFVGEKIDDSDINQAFNELIIGISEQVHLIDAIISQGDAFDGDKIKSDVRSGIDAAFSLIKSNLNNVGLNLSTYRSKVKTNWNDSILNNLESEIKNVIKLVEGDVSTSQNIKFVLDKILQIVSMLK